MDPWLVQLVRKERAPPPPETHQSFTEHSSSQAPPPLPSDCGTGGEGGDETLRGHEGSVKRPRIEGSLRHEDQVQYLRPPPDRADFDVTRVAVCV